LGFLRHFVTFQLGDRKSTSSCRFEWARPKLKFLLRHPPERFGQGTALGIAKKLRMSVILGGAALRALR